MERKEVSSSHIKSIGYDPSTITLEVEFSSLQVAQYQPISLQFYHQFMSSESKGRFFNQYLRNLPADSEIKMTYVQVERLVKPKTLAQLEEEEAQTLEEIRKIR